MTQPRPLRAFAFSPDVTIATPAPTPFPTNDTRTHAPPSASPATTTRASRAAAKWRQHGTPNTSAGRRANGEPALPLEVVGLVMAQLQREENALGRFLPTPQPALRDVAAMRASSHAFAAQAWSAVPEFEGGYVGRLLAQDVLGTGSMRRGQSARHLWKVRMLELRYGGVTITPGPGFDRLRRALGRAPRLRHLVLHGVHLRSQKMTELLAVLPSQLERLDLAENWLEATPQLFAALGALEDLRQLSLRSNWLHAVPLPQPLPQQHWGRLRVLELADNDLGTFPPQLLELTTLEALDLSRTGLDEVPEKVTKLTRLRSLRLSGNQLTELPLRLFSLPQLRELAVDGNLLHKLPAPMAVPTHLQRLEASHNKLTTLGPDFCAFTSLRHLNVEGNALRSLVGDARGWLELEELWARDNKLVCLADGLLKLPSLQVLDLANNALPRFGRARAKLAAAKFTRRFAYLRY